MAAAGAVAAAPAAAAHKGVLSGTAAWSGAGKALAPRREGMWVATADGREAHEWALLMKRTEPTISGAFELRGGGGWGGGIMCNGAMGCSR